MRSPGDATEKEIKRVLRLQEEEERRERDQERRRRRRREDSSFVDGYDVTRERNASFSIPLIREECLLGMIGLLTFA